jgi:hypothetical protein
MVPRVLHSVGVLCVYRAGHVYVCCCCEQATSSAGQAAVSCWLSGTAVHRAWTGVQLFSTSDQILIESVYINSLLPAV